MSREIRFRAWNRTKEEMIPSVGVLPMGGVLELVGEKAVGDVGAYAKEYRYLHSEKIELMQYTGLIDINHRLVYEGDIVKVYDMNRSCEECDLIDEGERNIHLDECEHYICTQEVKFDCGWFCREDTGDYCPPLNEHYIELEVIGNIYENKDIIS